jgi:hypothetical protein
VAGYKEGNKHGNKNVYKKTRKQSQNNARQQDKLEIIEGSFNLLKPSGNFMYRQI